MKLLTITDLCNYYSKHKNFVHYDAEKNNNDPVVVQVPGRLIFSEDEYDPEQELMKVHLKSSHIGDNRKRSNIEAEVMEACKKSIYNRPILGFIHKLSNDEYEFAGHEMFINDDGELEYEEIPVGCIPESCNAELIYDEEKDKTYLELDAVIYENYSRAADILRRKKESKVSVEISLLDYSYNPEEGKLIINKFIFTGVTILGVTRDGSETPIQEGMYGSKITLKDFSESNNSLFSSISKEENSKLIDTLERLNTTLSKFNNITDSNVSLEMSESENYGKEEKLVEDNVKLENEVVELENEETAGNNEVTETESTEEVVKVEEESTDETPEVVEETITEVESEDAEEEASEDTVEENNEETEKDTNEENPEVIEEESVNEKYSLNFELSMEDIRCGIYELLTTYAEADNDWYWIEKTYDSYFIYQSCCTGKYFRQSYTKEGTNISFEGNRVEVYAEFLTAEERTELENMRSNYSSIQSELSVYKENEALADKATVFEDSAYADYLETNEFKALMSKESILKFSKEELIKEADAILGKLGRERKLFTAEKENKESKKKLDFVAFPQTNRDDNSFIENLLKRKK